MLFLLVEIGDALGDRYETIRALCASPEKAREFCPYNKTVQGLEADNWFILRVDDSNEPMIECFEIRGIHVNQMMDDAVLSWHETYAAMQQPA